MHGAPLTHVPHHQKEQHNGQNHGQQKDVELCPQHLVPARDHVQARLRPPLTRPPLQYSSVRSSELQIRGSSSCDGKAQLNFELRAKPSQLILGTSGVN